MFLSDVHLLLFIVIALVVAIVIIAVKHKQSPVTAAETLEQDIVTDAKLGESKVAGFIHTLDADVVAKLHSAETASVLATGTTQAYVDAHTTQVQAAATVATAAAAQATTA